jgi:hypothetical protein
MKEKETMRSIQAKIELYARKLLEKAGFDILPDLPDIPGARSSQDKLGEKGISMTLSVAGYTKRYDGWDYGLSPEDWKKIFTIQWNEEVLVLLNFMQEHGNENMSLQKFKAAHGESTLKWRSFCTLSFPISLWYDSC